MNPPNGEMVRCRALERKPVRTLELNTRRQLQDRKFTPLVNYKACARSQLLGYSALEYCRLSRHCKTLCKRFAVRLFVIRSASHREFALSRALCCTIPTKLPLQPIHILHHSLSIWIGCLVALLWLVYASNLESEQDHSRDSCGIAVDGQHKPLSILIRTLRIASAAVWVALVHTRCFRTGKRSHL